MMVRIICLLLIASQFIGACKTLNNEFSDLKSKCGVDVLVGGDYLKFLSPNGEEIPGIELVSFRLRSDDQDKPLSFTQKGCALKDHLFATAVKSNVKARNWGFVLSEAEINDKSQISLLDIGSWNPTFQCPSTPLTNGSIPVPLTWDSKLVSQIPHLMIDDGQDFGVVDIELGASIDLHFIKRDGRHEVKYTWIDPFQGSKNGSCFYQIDRTPPRIVDELGGKDGQGSFQVAGGSRLRFLVEDEHAAGMDFCVYRPRETCRLLSSGPETLVTAPSAGRWCIQASATDKMGNRSPTTVKCGISIAEGELALLLANLQNAKHALEKSPLLQPILILRALKQYFSLETDEERKTVEAEMLASAISYGGQTFLRGMYRENRFDYFIKFEDSWGTLRDGNFALRDRFGKILNQQDVPALAGASFLTKGNELIAWRDNGEITIFGLENARLVERQVLNKPHQEGTYGIQLSWNPWRDEFAFAEQRGKTEGETSSSSSIIHFFRKNASGAYELNARLEINDASVGPVQSTSALGKMRWTKAGNFAAISTGLQTIVFRLNRVGRYELGTVISEAMTDLVLLQQDQDTFLVSTDTMNQVVTYSLGEHIERRGDPSTGQAKQNFFNQVFLQTSGDTAYYVESGFVKLSLKGGRVEHSSVFSELPHFSQSFWKWHEPSRILSFQSFKDVTLLKEHSTSFEILGVLPFETPFANRFYQALAYEHFGSELLTSSEDMLQTWGTQPLVGQVISYNSASTSDLLALLDKVRPSKGDLPPWLARRLPPFSGPNSSGGRDTVERTIVSAFNSDFATLSAHKVLRFYDKQGLLQSEIDTDFSDFSRVMLEFLDTDRFIALTEDLQYLVIQKNGNRYELVRRGNSEASEGAGVLKPQDLLRFNFSPTNPQTLRLAKGLISQALESPLIEATLRADGKYLAVLDERNLIHVFKSESGRFKKYSEFTFKDRAYALKWNIAADALDVSGREGVVTRFDLTRKEAIEIVHSRADSQNEALFLDDTYATSHRFRNAFVGSKLYKAEFSEDRRHVIFTLNNDQDNISSFEQNALRPGKGVDGVYIVPTDLRVIQKEMCRGLSPFLEKVLVTEDFEGLKASDKTLCE